MSLIRDAVKGLALAHALPIVGLVVSVIVALVGGVKLYGAHQRAVAFDKGAAFARDSARKASILREIHLKDSVAQSVVTKAKQASALVNDEARAINNAPRHTPRIEALPSTVPLTADTSLVGVTVESTGEHFILPRAAARYWYVSDSLVGVAKVLLDKYAAANKQWADAWSAEHDAREASDSLVALLQSRDQTSAQPRKSRRLVTLLRAAALVGVGFIAAKRLH